MPEEPIQENIEAAPPAETEKPKGKRGNPNLVKGQRPYNVYKNTFEIWLENHPGYDRKSKRSGPELIRAFLYEKTTLKGNPTRRTASWERIQHILNSLFLTACNGKNRNQVAAAQLLISYGLGKPPSSDADLSAVKKGGVTLVYVNRPQIDPEIKMAPQQALEAAPPEFIENEVQND